jgi:hypothetical protein
MGNIFVKLGLEQLSCTGIFGPTRPDKVNAKADAALAGETNRDMRQPSRIARRFLMSEMTLIHPDKVQAAGYDPARLVNMNVLHIIDAQNGLGRSAMAKRFGLGSIEEASAYLADHSAAGSTMEYS